MTSEKRLRTLLWLAAAMVLLTAFVIGIKQLREPDLWWQLRTGEWILQHGRVMQEDVFSYTFQGAEWINVKWGFEVIIALFSKLGGPEIIMLLQSFINLLLLYFIYRLYRLMRGRLYSIESALPSLGLVLAAWLLLFGLEFRMNGRPEILSHLMTPIFLLLLLRYRYKPGNFIYLLVPLQVLWTNLHEAYGTGMVMVVAMTASAWAEYLFYPRLKRLSRPALPKALSIAAVLCILAPALHPYGIRMIWHPLDIFSQVSENKFTTELVSFTRMGYWQKEAYLNVFLCLLSILGLFLPYPSSPQSSKKEPFPWYLRPLANFGLGYVVMLALFFYLSLTAYRNIPFFIIVSAPLLAVTFDWLGGRMAAKYPMWRKDAARMALPVVFILFGILAYAIIVTNTYYQKFGGDRNRYGLRVDPEMNPNGAAVFIRNNHLQGHNFSDFLISNYLLWKLQPNFKTFIDLRDLDVFPAGFFRNFGYLQYRPEAVMQLDKDYHFNYAVVYRGSFLPLHNFLANSPLWAAVYADPVCVVYVRNNAANQAIIRQYGLNTGHDIFHAPLNIPTSGLAKGVASLFWPAWKPDKQLSDAEVHLIAADYYPVIGQFKRAEGHVDAAIGEDAASSHAWLTLGNIKVQESIADSVPSRSDQFLNDAQTAYEKALSLDKKSAQAYYGLGRVASMRQDYGTAAAYLKKSVKYDAGFQNAWLLLAEVQNGLMSANPSATNRLLKERADYLSHALALDPDNIMIRFYLGITYGQAGDCDHAVKELKQAPSYPGAPANDVKLAKSILMQCGGVY